MHENRAIPPGYMTVGQRPAGRQGKGRYTIADSLASRLHKAHGGRPTFRRMEKAGIDESLTAAMGLESMAKKTYASLSAGQKRRLHLVLALIGNPDIIFLDEPTAALDIEGREAFYSQIRRLKEQGKTIVLSSHDMAEVENLCDRMAILREGKIAFLGTAAELHAKMGGRHTICIQTPGGWEQHAADNIGETMLRLLTDLQERGVPVLDIKIDRGRLARDFMEIARREEQ